MSIISKLEQAIGTGRITNDDPRAELYVELDNLDDMITLVRKARESGISVFVFGGGTFVTFPKEGIKGLVIKNNCHRFDTMSMRGTLRGDHMGVRDVLITAESGVIMNQFVRFTLNEELEGLEYQLGLPGTVGGAIVTNAKYSSPTVSAKYVRDFLYSMRILHEDGEIRIYTKDLPYFVVDETLETKDILLSVAFKLLPGDKKVLWERGQEAVEYRSKYRERHKALTVIARSEG